MSSLMVSNLDLMMLEFAVQKVTLLEKFSNLGKNISNRSSIPSFFLATPRQLFVPKTSIFDSVVMKKTTVMFRALNCDWTGLNPHRADYTPYRGSNLEEEDFHGGKSVVFAVPSERLREKVNGVDVEINVRKEISKYFEMEACQSVGTALVNVDDLFNAIVKELAERRELDEYLSGFHKRQPISRSLKGAYKIVDGEKRSTGATISVYVRLSHLGKSVVTEIELGRGRKRDFYAQEESNEGDPYRCRELKSWQLESGCWGERRISRPGTKVGLSCRCDSWASMIKPDVISEDSDEEAPMGRMVDDCGDDGKGAMKRVSRGEGVSTSGRGSVARSSTGDGKKRLGGGESPRASRVQNRFKGKEEASGAKRGSKVSKADGDRVSRESAGVPVGRADHPRPRKAVSGSAKKPRGTEAAERTDNAKDQRTPDRFKAKSADAASDRRLQLRGRQHGIITVGLADKERKICHEEPRSTSLPTCPAVLRTSSSIRPTICSNIHSHYCCPTISSCKTTLTRRTPINGSSPMYACCYPPVPILVPEVTICTS